MKAIGIVKKRLIEPHYRTWTKVIALNSQLDAEKITKRWQRGVIVAAS